MSPKRIITKQLEEKNNNKRASDFLKQIEINSIDLKRPMSHVRKNVYKA